MDGYLVQQSLKGRMFIGSTTYAGVVVPAYNATAQKFGLWNPAGSTRNLVLDKITMSLATIGTEALAGFGLSYLTGTSASIATGSPITAFTATTPVNGLLNEGDTPVGKFTLNATTSAPTHFYDIGMALISTDLNTATCDGFSQLMHDFNGAIVVTPGVYIGLGSSAASGQTLRVSLTWYETDR